MLVKLCSWKITICNLLWLPRPRIICTAQTYIHVNTSQMAKNHEVSISDDFMLNLAIKESLKTQCAEMHTQYEEPGVSWLNMLQGEEKIPTNFLENSGEVCEANHRRPKREM